MSDEAGERWDLVFRGDIVLGHNLEDVKKRLMQLFKADAAKIEELFSGRPVTLKRDMDRATADKYQAVLQKAGAEVALVNAAKRREPPPPRKSPSPAGTPQQPGLSLAPVGGDLLKPDERGGETPVSVDISGLSLRPPGELLDDAERSESVAEMAVPSYDLAEVGADLSTADERGDLPLAQPDISDWEIREAGEDLLSPQERQPEQAASVKELEADLAPVGAELGQKPREAAPKAPDTSHLNLQE